MKDLPKTSFLAKDKGKQPIDFTRMQAKKREERNPVERVELASISTRERPLLLGGTLEDAQKYIRSLSAEDDAAYHKYCRDLKALARNNIPNPTEIAREGNETGYQIKRKYNSIHKSKKSEADVSRPTTGQKKYRGEASRPTTGQLGLKQKQEKESTDSD
jgi:hypothetical protein